MVTTIQLNENVKNALDKMKTSKETYEELIIRMMNFIEEQKRRQEQLLIEGCKEMYDDMLKIAKEWEGTLMDGLDKNEKWSKL
jgi:predicted CopG family antitoxin